MQQTKAIADFLRPSFEVFQHPRTRRDREQRELAAFTQDQYEALDAMSDNQRVFFTGPAGTGKTVLAVEAARRSAAVGMEVLFVCYNRFLHEYVAETVSHTSPKVVCRTLHQHMLRVVGTPAPVDVTSTYWSNDLPKAALKQLLDGCGHTKPCDVLIVDEAQDLLCGPYLDILDLSLRGGLSSGCWRMFGDFERQMLFGADCVGIDAFQRERAPDAPRYALRTNCRNRPRVATLCRLLGGLDPDYSRVLRPDDGVEPCLIYYERPSDQERLLDEVLRDLMSQGFSAGDIVILSPSRNEQCAASRLTHSTWRTRLRPFGDASQQHIRFTSIHSFKGLEAPAVVVTDVHRVDGDKAGTLFYTAITRALQRLVMLIHETAKDDILAQLIGRTAEND